MNDDRGEGVAIANLIGTDGCSVVGWVYLRIPGFADSHSNGTRTVIPGCADKVRAGC